jgi:DNA-binding CsgD family transcriptional regulator
MADLSKLSAAEREALLLLADGHTAKSAAALLGLSVGVFNERLRSARAKTSAGSSRTLARQVRVAFGERQEIWPKQIGMARSPPAGARKAPTPVLTLSIGLTRGALAMTAAAIAATALGAVLLTGAFTSAAHSAQPPHVVRTSPTAGAVLPAGPAVLTVTFDRPMRPQSYSFVERSPQTFPRCPDPPTQSADGRSYSLRCTLEPRRTYEIMFNSDRHRNFAAVGDGAPAVPATLRFTTR